MICFAVSLRSPESTLDWKTVEKNFNNTLHSLFNQTCGDFEVYVGCNEMPGLYEDYGSRLHILTDPSLGIPKNHNECSRDRAWKLLMCGVQIKKDLPRLTNGDPEKGVYVMLVDADDYVSGKLAGYCHDNPDANGFKSKRAYSWMQGSKKLLLTPYFGGTMNVMKLYPDDFPDEMPPSETSLTYDMSIQLQKYPMKWIDCEIEGKFRDMGRAFSVLPFPSTIYVLGTGNNISLTLKEKAASKKRFHPIGFLRKIYPFDKRFLSEKIKKEFGMQP